MMIRGTQALALVGGLFLGTVAAAEEMTHAQYESAEDKIEFNYKVAKGHCGKLAGNAKEVCVEEAKGAQSVEKAELEARHEPTARNIQDVRQAKAEAKYSVAMERCEAKSGNDEDVCKQEAKAARVHARSDISSRSDDRDADYAVAKEKCDTFSGDTKDRCVDDAKARFARQ
jgi:hypothetical protein